MKNNAKFKIIPSESIVHTNINNITRGFNLICICTVMVHTWLLGLRYCHVISMLWNPLLFFWNNGKVKLSLSLLPGILPLNLVRLVTSPFWALHPFPVVVSLAYRATQANLSTRRQPHIRTSISQSRKPFDQTTTHIIIRTSISPTRGKQMGALGVACTSTPYS